MLGAMTERRQADVPWADAPMPVRLAITAGVAVVAILMAIGITGSRGLAIGILLVLFWGGLGVLAFVYPRTLQGWARERLWFSPVLTLGVVLFALLFLTSIPTAVALLFSFFVFLGLLVIARFRRHRPATPQAPTRGRRHS